MEALLQEGLDGVGLAISEEKEMFNVSSALLVLLSAVERSQIVDFRKL